jgi:hypothetical protein
MCGSEETHPYTVRRFSYHNEQARVDEVKRVIVYIMLNLDVSILVLWSGII